MIQLVPSLKYNRSIDSAVNLALVNIQKQEERQQGHTSHIHMAMPNSLHKIDSQDVPKDNSPVLDTARESAHFLLQTDFIVTNRAGGPSV